MVNLKFHKILIQTQGNLFNELISSVDFEELAKGRIGNNLVAVENKGVPIVRTTTKYSIPPNKFSDIHYIIISYLNCALQSENSNLSSMVFNNALVEVYDYNYYKMNYHSDQCLDLENDSYIGLFSCYENPDNLYNQNIRKLIVKDKLNSKEFEIPLTHNSFVVFSLETNNKFLHKIVLGSGLNHLSSSDNRWLGVTFRKSKTFIKFENNIPYFPDGQLLSLADDEQRIEFYKLRGQENRNLNYVYPKMTYTLSIGDTLMPKNS